MVIDDLANFGKRTLQTALVLASTQCVSADKVHFQAPKHYSLDPVIRHNRAVYALKGLLEESCFRHSVDDDKFMCLSKDCIERSASVGINPISREYEVDNVCANYQTALAQYRWNEIGSVAAENNCVKFNRSNRCQIFTRNSKQAKDFKRALGIYLRQRR